MFLFLFYFVCKQVSWYCNLPHIPPCPTFTVWFGVEDKHTSIPVYANTICGCIMQVFILDKYVYQVVGWQPAAAINFHLYPPRECHLADVIGQCLKLFEARQYFFFSVSSDLRPLMLMHNQN
jgi:hypothetical protein